MLTRALLALLLAFPAWAGFGYKTTVTVDKAKVPNTNQTDFPWLFCANGATGTNCDAALGTLSVPELKTVGNGGVVTNANCYDCIPTTDTTCATYTLDWEIEYYDGTTGRLYFWIRSTLTTATNYTLTLCLGNAAITTFQGNTNGTWNSAYKAVWHWPNGSLLSVTDSTSNARNGTNTGTPLATAGKIDGGYNQDNTQSYTTTSDTGLPSGNNDRTISIWINPNATSTGYAWCLGNFATANQCFCLTFRNTNTTVDLYDGSLRSFAFTTTVGTWSYIVVTWTSGSTRGEVFANGSSLGTWTNASQNTTLTGTYYIAETNPAAFNTPINAKLDEHRISNVVRSNDWITTEWNNQSSPSTFYSIAAVSPISTGGCVTGGGAGGGCVIGGN